MAPGAKAARSQARLQAATAAQLERMGCGGRTPTDAGEPLALARLLLQGAAMDRVEAQALAAAVRELLAELAAQHPGNSIEVRVPPYAAAQIGLGEGPAHTRGTPPNVIETDALTFLRLATGGLSWDAARASGSLAASGAHSDLSGLFPFRA